MTRPAVRSGRGGGADCTRSSPGNMAGHAKGHPSDCTARIHRLRSHPSPATIGRKARTHPLVGRPSSRSQSLATQKRPAPQSSRAGATCFSGSSRPVIAGFLSRRILSAGEEDLDKRWHITARIGNPRKIQRLIIVQGGRTIHESLRVEGWLCRQLHTLGNDGLCSRPNARA